MEVVRPHRSTRVRIDLNVRARHGLVRAGFEDADGPLSVGDDVVVYEPEDGIEGLARVQELDDSEQFVYLDVDWSTFLEQPAVEQPPAVRFLSYTTNIAEIVDLQEGRVGHGLSNAALSGWQFPWPEVSYAPFAIVADPAWVIVPRIPLTAFWWYGGVQPLGTTITVYVDYGGSDEGPSRDTSELVRSA
jgi:hypothetical protein